MKSASGSRSPVCSPNTWSIETGAALGIRSSNTPRPIGSGADGAAATGAATGASGANGSKSSGSSMSAGSGAGADLAADDAATPAAAGSRLANGSIGATASAAGAAFTGADFPSKSAKGLLRESGARRSPKPGTALPAEARAVRLPPCGLVARRSTPGVDASTAARPRTTVSASASGASSWITSSR